MDLVDLRGLECPVPTLRTVEAVKKARAGGNAVTVIVDDPVCVEEIPMQARRWAYSADVALTADSEWTIQLTPLDAPASQSREPSTEEAVI
jgi:TusA-related sulfurtransferase